MSFLLVSCSKNNTLDEVNLFSSSLLAVTLDGESWGYVNAEGEVIIDFVYQSLKVYDDGFVLFRKLYLFGVMDKQYNIIINETYKYINADVNVFFQPY